MSVVQHIDGAGGGFSTTYNGGATPLTISNTPNSSTDILWLLATATRDGVKGTGVSGCDATWTKVANTADADEEIQLWRGVNPSSTGTVTITYNGSTWAQASLTHSRDIASTVGTPVISTNNDSGSDLSGTVTCGQGQLAFGRSHSDLMTALVGSTPASGWVNSAVISAATGTDSATCYRLGSGSATNHQVTATNSNTATGQHLIVTVGDLVVPANISPPAATATADAAVPTVGAGISPPAATAQAEAPGPVVAANVSPPSAGASAQAAPPVLNLQQAYFTPPTYEEAVDDHFWGRYSIPVGRSVVMVEGHYQVMAYPWLGTIAELEQGVEWFGGGRTYPISGETAAALEADGFTVTRQ